MEFNSEESVKKYFEDNECEVTHYKIEHLMLIEYGEKQYTLCFKGENFTDMIKDIVNILKQIK